MMVAIGQDGAAVGIPDLHSAVVRTGCDTAVIRRPAEAGDRFRVTVIDIGIGREKQGIDEPHAAGACQRQRAQTNQTGQRLSPRDFPFWGLSALLPGTDLPRHRLRLPATVDTARRTYMRPLRA